MGAASSSEGSKERSKTLEMQRARAARDAMMEELKVEQQVATEEDAQEVSTQHVHVSDPCLCMSPCPSPHHDLISADAEHAYDATDAGATTARAGEMQYTEQEETEMKATAATAAAKATSRTRAKPSRKDTNRFSTKTAHARGKTTHDVDA